MGSFIWGSIVGLVVGTITALFTLPKSGRALRQQMSATAQETSRAIQQRVETAVPSDPVADSIAQGKAAARRRMDDLGLRRGN
ncbi:MAG: YtxH domain-containing protein [Chloroflexota bacterium]|nr:YtxH domain-containing protein [Chloroflexota bacterium]